MPVVTNEDIWSGAKGVTVVLLRRMAATPTIGMTEPNYLLHLKLIRLTMELANSPI